MFSLRFGGSFNWGLPRRPQQQKRGNRQLRSGDGATAAGSETLAQRIGGFGGLAQAGIVAGGVAGVGSLVGQAVVHKQAQDAGEKPGDYDYARLYRVAAAGALLVGPYSHLLFSLLNSLLPKTSLPNVIAKTALSQVALAPSVLALLYVWNLVGQEGKETVYSAKVKHDLTPSTADGWRLWIPALALNFLAVPAQGQVFFTTAAASLFSAYKSPAKPVIWTKKAPAPPAPEPVPEPPAPVPAKKSGRFNFDLNDKKVTVSAIALWIAACVLLKKD